MLPWTLFWFLTNLLSTRMMAPQSFLQKVMFSSFIVLIHSYTLNCSCFFHQKVVDTHHFLNFLCYFEKQQKIDFIWNHKLPTSNVHHNKPGGWLKLQIYQSTQLWPISAIGKFYQSTWALTCVGCSVPGPGSVPGKPGYHTTPTPTGVRGIIGTCCYTPAYTSPSRQENIKSTHSSLV